mmetsp:Transcript_13960/g.25588  ORF Transcript_13960/g.25588 Transcript_13960/m.25588 type:complete len:237 (+) Transcript_13960:195-905(+)
MCCAAWMLLLTPTLLNLVLKSTASSSRGSTAETQSRVFGKQRRTSSGAKYGEQYGSSLLTPEESGTYSLLIIWISPDGRTGSPVPMMRLGLTLWHMLRAGQLSMRQSGRVTTPTFLASLLMLLGSRLKKFSEELAVLFMVASTFSVSASFSSSSSSFSTFSSCSNNSFAKALFSSSSSDLCLSLRLLTSVLSTMFSMQSLTIMAAARFPPALSPVTAIFLVLNPRSVAASPLTRAL